MSRTHASLMLAAVCVASTAGCAVGPDYVPPKIDPPADFRNQEQPGLNTEEVDAATWWQRFHDPVLDQLMIRLREGNLDLGVALERIRESRAIRRSVAGNLYPQVGLDGSYTDSKSGDLFNLGLDAAWEIDIFGGRRRSVESAEAEIGSAIESFRDVLVSLRAELALSYVEARLFHERLRITRANVEAQRRTLTLVQGLYDSGLAPELDVAQAQTNLSTTSSEIALLHIGLERTLNRIAVLLGERPGAVHQLFADERTIPVPPETIAIGIPADLVRRRPDIRRAERRLAAQTARIGVATAELYPRFSLTGTLDQTSTEVGDLLKEAGRTWSYGAFLRWNILNFGRIRGRILAEEALTRAAFQDYKLTVLNALEETENALKAYAEDRSRRAHLERAAAESARAVEMSRALYTEGLSNFQTVLDSERTLFVLQEQLALNAGDITKDAIVLYKAIGGAWSQDTDPLPAATDPQQGGQPWSAWSGDESAP